MELLRLRVRDFGCIGVADVEFGPGLNIVYGPNDLGKSTVAAAVRAALLLPHGSSAAKEFVPWSSGLVPSVELTFRVDDRIYRVSKTWGTGRAGSSRLQWSTDGQTFSAREQGRGVDGVLRELLGWGIGPPGGKRAHRGLPRSFLSTVLLGEQGTPHALLGQSMLDDSESSGRDRLSEALQAMAQDELYAGVLERVQVKVDEAFTPAGRPKGGRESPWKRMDDEVKRLQDRYEVHERSARESEAVALRLAELAEDRDRAAHARDQAQQRLSTLRRDVQRQDALLAHQREVEQAEEAHADALALATELERLTTELERCDAALPGAQARVREAVRGSEVAELALAHARERLEAVERGGDPRAQLEIAELERAALEVAAQREQRRVVEQSHAALAQARTRYERTAAGIDTGEFELADIRKERAELDDRLAEVGAEIERLGAAVRMVAVDELAGRAEQAGRAAVRRDALRTRAAALDAEAHSLAAEADVRIPEAHELERLRELHETWRVAAATKGSGVRVRLSLGSRPTSVAVALDGAPVRAAADELVFAAEQQIVLELGEGLRVEVEASQPPDGGAFEAAARAFADAAEPWLRRLSVSDFSGLRARVDTLAKARDAARECRGEAENLRGLAAAEATMADDAAPLAARLADEQARLREQGLDLASVADVLAHADLASVEAELQAARALEQHIKAELEDRVRAETERETELRLGRERSKVEHAELVAAQAVVDASVRTSVADAELEQEAERLAVRLTQLKSAAVQARAGAERALADATLMAERARAETETAQSELATLQRQRSGAEAAAAVHTERSNAIDHGALATRVRTLRDTLAELPQPTALVDAAMLTKAEAQLLELQHQLDDVAGRLHQQEGALAQVGGNVARERAETARDALDAARARQSELELDYHAWHLLLGALRDAENDESRHLGNLLAGRVAQRFGDLTGRRYGGLALGPDLQTGGLHTVAGVQPIENLSEGLKEQLATILRVTVAEELRGTLVLDDHLTQTDHGRLAWFREFLQRSAERIQVVVVTCRPADYLPQMPSEAGASHHQFGPRLHAVDLQRVVQRSLGSEATIAHGD